MLEGHANIYIWLSGMGDSCVNERALLHATLTDGNNSESIVHYAKYLLLDIICAFFRILNLPISVFL